MGLVVDVDAVAKLAHWRILLDLPSLTGIPWTETSTVPSLQYRTQRALSAPDGKLFRHVAAAQIVLQALGGMRPLPAVDGVHLDAFQSAPGIDVGEAVLLAILSGNPDEHLLTGDKRALRGVSQLERQAWSPFAGRIIVLEEIVLRGLTLHGIEWLRKRICPDREVDLDISIALGSRCDAPVEVVTDGLESYINEMRRLCDPSLLRPPT